MRQAGQAVTVPAQIWGDCPRDGLHIYASTFVTVTVPDFTSVFFLILLMKKHDLLFLRILVA